MEFISNVCRRVVMQANYDEGNLLLAGENNIISIRERSSVTNSAKCPSVQSVEMSPRDGFLLNSNDLITTCML